MMSPALRDTAYVALMTWLFLDGLLVFTKYSGRAKSADERLRVESRLDRRSRGVRAV